MAVDDESNAFEPPATEETSSIDHIFLLETKEDTQKERKRADNTRDGIFVKEGMGDWELNMVLGNIDLEQQLPGLMDFLKSFV